MTDRYICACCLVDAHPRCPPGHGCQCECRTGKPLIVRSPAARAGKPAHKVVAEREQVAAAVSAGKPELAPAAVRAAVEAMRAEQPPTEPEPVTCKYTGCDRTFRTREAALVHFSRAHTGPAPEVPCRLACGRTFKSASGEAMHWKHTHKDGTVVDVPAPELDKPETTNAFEEVALADEMSHPTMPSQRVLDVADCIAVLDRVNPADVLATALDLWAEQQIAEREDVSTIVRVVTKNRMAATA